MNLKTILLDRQNGLTQSRVILAFFVLFDHHLAVFNVSRPQFYNTPIPLSSFAVYMFIFMSGLLCFESRYRHTTSKFLLNRFARIFPGYFACLLISAIVFIPLMIFISNNSFFLDLAQFKLLVSSSFEYLYKNIAFTQNLYMPSSLNIDLNIGAINGSLWTLQPEIVGYVLIAIMFPLFILIPRMVLVVLISFCVLVFSDPSKAQLLLQPILRGYGFEISTESHLHLGLYLLSGIVYSLFSRKIIVSKLIFSLVFLLTVLFSTLNPHLALISSPIFLPYLFICFCWFFRWPWGVKADYSFGVYLYSFPIQQIFFLMQKHNYLSISYTTSFALVIASSFVMGIISFNCFETPGRRLVLSLASRVKS